MTFERRARRRFILAARIHLCRLTKQGAHEQEASKEEGDESLHEATGPKEVTPLFYSISSVSGKGSLKLKIRI